MMSRNRWKCKAKDRKVEIKRLQNHVASLQRGRDEWKRRVKALEHAFDQSQTRVRELEKQLAAVPAQKKKIS
jgi:phage shock protein A